MNAFHVIGSITAICAVLVGVLGITREDFPRGGAEKVVGVLAALLVAATVSAAIITAANEGDDHGGGDEEATQSESH